MKKVFLSAFIVAVLVVAYTTIPQARLDRNWALDQKVLPSAEYLSDEKVQILLQNRQDIFDDYTLDNFKSIFSKHFIIEKAILLEPTERVLLLMKKHKSLE